MDPILRRAYTAVEAFRSQGEFHVSHFARTRVSRFGRVSFALRMRVGQPGRRARGFVDVEPPATRRRVDDEVSYQVSGNGITPISNIVDTSGPGTTFSFSVSVPSGQGYTIALSAVATNGERSCAGSAPFDITAGETTVVQVELSCARTGTVQVDGEANLCVELLDPVFSALEAPIGSTIDFGVLALDRENDRLNSSGRPPEAR